MYRLIQFQPQIRKSRLFKQPLSVLIKVAALSAQLGQDSDAIC